MFSLFYGFWKYMFSKTEFHVLILGIDKAGKTTLLEKLKSQYSNVEGLPPDRIVPTVGLNIGRPFLLAYASQTDTYREMEGEKAEVMRKQMRQSVEEKQLLVADAEVTVGEDAGGRKATTVADAR
ncbi:hypothetical protein POM88_047941 [Heracleum sosnowskyi]|uniref:ADP-ribosylation factor n=1 Tax=Heracleum sosnowskyi TaxID=360622 RepID=A0AAD8GV52_9APIA|nr:hypothetical protein POM88_047941 [Heracleum sosnowskyi]